MFLNSMQLDQEYNSYQEYATQYKHLFLDLTSQPALAVYIGVNIISIHLSYKY